MSKSNDKIISVEQAGPAETKCFEKLKQFALGQLSEHRLDKRVENFEVLTAKMSDKPFFNVLFCNEKAGDFVSVMNILVIAGKPICRAGKIRVAIAGGDYVL